MVIYVYFFQSFIYLSNHYTKVGLKLITPKSRVTYSITEPARCSYIFLTSVFVFLHMYDLDPCWAVGRARHTRDPTGGHWGLLSPTCSFQGCTLVLRSHGAHPCLQPLPPTLYSWGCIQPGCVEPVSPSGAGLWAFIWIPIKMVWRLTHKHFSDILLLFFTIKMLEKNP